MRDQQNHLSLYLENVRYYCEPGVMRELRDILKMIYDSVKAQPELISYTLLESLDLNIRHLLKSLLAEKSEASELPEFQKIITISQSVIKRCEDKNTSQEYIFRWQFANQIIQDRKHELSMDSDKLISRPQVVKMLELLALKKRTRRETIETALSISKQRATNLLRNLKVASLVTEFVSDEDKRAKEYELSELGEEKCIERGINLQYKKPETDYENSVLYKNIIKRHLRFGQNRTFITLATNAQKKVSKLIPLTRAAVATDKKSG